MFTFLIRRRCCGGGLRMFHNRWRSIATQTQTKTSTDLVVQPWLMLSSPTNPDTRYFFDIAGDGILELNREIHLPKMSSSVCIGSSAGFLFTIPTRQSPEINAIDPLNPEEVDRLLLPSTATLGSVEYCLNHSFFGLKYRSWTKRSGEVVVLDEDWFSLYVSKIVLSPSRDVAVLLRNGKADYARLSGSPSTWTPIETLAAPPTAKNAKCLGILNDCIFHEGRLHVCNHAGRLAVVDMGDPSAAPLFYPDAPWPVHRDAFHSPFRRSLVESPDGKDLFFVMRLFARLCDHTFLFEVYKLDKVKAEWSQIGSIGDLVFFVGPNTSVAVSAVHFPNLKPNSIYFTDHHMQNYLFDLNDEDVGDTGVFSLDDGSVQFFNLTHGHEELNWPRPVWFMPVVK